MASASHNCFDGDQDTVPPPPPREHDTVISPATNNQEQLPMDNTDDPRDGREASLSTDEDGDDVQIFTERQLEKRPQST
ncbi:hypothetical protein A2U01_0074036, partial [Trifolium medium]|nr:hypothetical protein [Trifolium medium]